MALSVTVQGIAFEISPEVLPEIVPSHAADGSLASYTETWHLSGQFQGSTTASKWAQLSAVAKTVPVTVVFLGTGLALSPAGSAPGTPRVTRLRATGGNWVSLIKFELDVERIVPVSAAPAVVVQGQPPTPAAAGPSEAAGLVLSSATVRSEFDVGPDGRVRHRVRAGAEGRDAKEFVARAVRGRVADENLVSVHTTVEEGVGANGAALAPKANAVAEEEAPEEEQEEETAAAEARDPTALGLPAKPPEVELFRHLRTESVSGGLPAVKAHRRAGRDPLVTIGPAESSRLVVSGRASAVATRRRLLDSLRGRLPPEGPGILSDFDFRDLGPTDFDDRDRVARFGLEYTATFTVPKAVAGVLPTVKHVLEQTFGRLGKK